MLDARRGLANPIDAHRLNETKKAEARKFKRAVKREIERLELLHPERSYLASTYPPRPKPPRLHVYGSGHCGHRVSARDLERVLGRNAFLVWRRMLAIRGSFVPLHEQRDPEHVLRRTVHHWSRGDGGQLSYQQTRRAIKKLVDAGLVESYGRWKRLLPEAKWEGNPDGVPRLIRFWARRVFGDYRGGYVAEVMPETVRWAAGVTMHGGARKGSGRQTFERLTLEDVEHLPTGTLPWVGLRELRRFLGEKTWKVYQHFIRHEKAQPHEDQRQWIPAEELEPIVYASTLAVAHRLQEAGLINPATTDSDLGKEKFWGRIPNWEGSEDHPLRKHWQIWITRPSGIDGAYFVPKCAAERLLRSQLPKKTTLAEVGAAEEKRKTRRARRLSGQAVSNVTESSRAPCRSTQPSLSSKKSSSSSQKEDSASPSGDSGPDFLEKRSERKKQEIKTTPSGARYVDDGETIRLLPPKKKRRAAPAPIPPKPAEVLPLFTEPDPDIAAIMDEALCAPKLKIGQYARDLLDGKIAERPAQRFDIAEFCPLPSTQEHLAFWPGACALPSELSDAECVQALASLYNGAVEHFYKRKSYAFRVGRFTLPLETKHATRMLKAAQHMRANGIEPARWIAWSIDQWNFMQAGKPKRKPPPVGWVFSVDRMTNFSGWYGREAHGYCVRRLYIGARRLWDSFNARRSRLQEFIRFNHPTRAQIVEMMNKLFPQTFRAELREVVAEAESIQGGLEHRLNCWEWIWA